MRAPLSWLKDFVAIPADQTGRDVADRLTNRGLEVESVETLGAGLTGPLVIGKVIEIDELTEYKKPIRFCQVDVGVANGGVRGIVCGASNFIVGDTVAVALPGAVLPGEFAITARETYGKTSDGMICSERELGLGEKHDGIIVLPPDIAEIGTDATEILGIGDAILDVAVTPDRGYALSIRGIAREVAIAYDLPFTDPGLELVNLLAPSGKREPHPCAIDDTSVCDVLTLRSIVGFDPGAPSPQWMRQRLTACGMRSISLAVDVTNYVMLETGQPLHAFDLGLIQGTLRAGRAEPGEVLETLDHVQRPLSLEDIVIRDDSGPIGLAGTMGGFSTEINDATCDIALEAAHFIAVEVARTARRHGLSTEASRRFERGVDPLLPPYASARATQLLLEFGGGTYTGMTAMESPIDVTRITMAATHPGDVAGMPIARTDVVHYLFAIGCDVSGDDDLTVTPPSWRPDLCDPADLVEEVLRLRGYETLPSTLPAANAGFGFTRAQRERRRVGMALAGAGFIEILNSPFIGEPDLDALGIPPRDVRRRAPRLANPLSDERPLMRSTLLPGLIAAARRNLGRGATNLAIYEIGSVSHWPATRIDRPWPALSMESRPTNDEQAVIETKIPMQFRSIGLLVCGEVEPTGWWGEGRHADAFAAIAAAQRICATVGLETTVVAANFPPFHPGRCAAITAHGATLGYAGELHPRVVEATGLPPRTVAAELNLDAIFYAGVDARPAPAVGTFPVAKEDLALVVNESVSALVVQDALREGAGELLESVRLFDVYIGPQVGEGKKSLAFALRFRATDRTLSAEETTAARQSALDHAAQRCGAVLR